MEILPQIILPSVSTPTPSGVAEATSYVVSLRDECQQAIGTLTTAVGNAQQTWHQDIIQFQSYFEYEVEQLLGIVPSGNPPAPTATQPPSEPSSGHGWGSGTMSTAYEGAYNPPMRQTSPSQGESMLSPLDDSGSGSSGSGSGSGSGSSSGSDNPPVASGGSFSVLHDRELDNYLSGSDDDLDSLTFSEASGPSHGSLTVNSDGSFTYIPTAGYVGSDSFTYTVSDGTLTSDPGTVSIAVTDNAPVADGGSFSVLHDRELDGYAGGTDDDLDSLTASLVSGPSNGGLQFDSDGSFTYTPDAGYIGSDSFQYKLNDGAEDSNTATITIAVTDNAPVADGGSYSVIHDRELDGYAGGSDDDLDSLTASLVSGPSNGSLNFNGDGSFTYVPKAGYVGSDSFTYTVSDGILTSDPATVSIAVTDNAPVADDENYSVIHDRELDGFVGGTDDDLDSLTASLVSGPSNGDLDLNGDGSFTYTPDAGYVGSDSFQYKLNDGVEDSNTATVNIDVTDNAPVADGGSFTVLHDRELDNYLSGSDDDLDSLTFSEASGPSHGSLTVNSDGSFTYTPTAGYVGSDSFTYTVNDGALTSDPATVSIDVTDNAPVANPDSYTVAKNSAATSYGSVLGNDTDSDGDVLTATLGSGVSHGTLTFHSDGSFSYQPTSGYTGSDSFSYTASDGAESSEPASVSLNVVDEGTLTVNPDSYSILHDSTLSVATKGVLANDSDSDGDDLTASLSGNASNGSVTLNSDGSFTYQPNAGYVGSDSFSYTASDGDNTSDPVRVTIEVTDNAPVADGGSFSVLHDEELDGEVGGSDADGDALTFSVASQPGNGTLDFNSDGSFSYVPTSGYVGNDSFSYTVSDGALTSMPATVSIDVTDQAPTAGDLDYDLPENSSLNVSAAAGLLSAASDADGDDLTASVSSGPAYGSLSVNSDGSFTYTPDSDYSGSDSFQYTVSDGALTSMPATVTLSIHPVDTAPTVGPAGYSVVHDRELDGEVSGSDADGDTLTFSAASAPSHGSLSVNSDGSFSYTPTAGYLGTDSFTYLASDGQLSSDPATVTIDVTDQAPVANGDSFEVERNNDLFVEDGSGVLANDTDADGDTLTASVVSGPSHGTLNFDGDGFDYTPDANFFGSDSFTYKANDGVLDSNTATVTLTVTASPPVAGDDGYDVLKDHALVVPANGVLGNDYSPDNLDVTAGGASQAAHGSVSLNSDGSFTYTPDAGYTGSDSFTYTASDSTGLTSDPATVTINVTKTNTPPTAGDLSYSLNHDTSLSTDGDSGVLSGASDADNDKLTAVLDSGPSNGTLEFNSDGSFTYTPTAGFHGTDSFTFQAFDGTDLSNVATATLNVLNKPPTANPDSYTVLASGATTTGSVLANDTDPENDDLTAVLVSGPSDGDLTFNSDGSFTYTPNANFTDSDSFSYKASDGVNFSTPTTVTLTSGPVAADQGYSVIHDRTLSVDASGGLLTGASDADGDKLTAALASGPSHGTVTVNSDGSFTYTPNTHFVGTDSFTFTVSDGSNTSSPATATIDVTNQTPVAGAQSWDTPEDTALTVNAAEGVVASSSDSDGDSLAAELVSGPSNGSLTLSSGGNFIYTPNSGFYGTDSFTYDVTDGVASSDPVTVTITVDQVVSEGTPLSEYSAVASAEGDTEVVVADKGLNQVDVFLVDGNGNLAPTPVSTIAVGAAPVALAVGDFNGDGHSDVAVANSGAGTVSILLGSGGGAFTLGTTLTGFADPVAVVAGDFGNGQEDLAVVNESSNTVSILLGNGNGTFTPYGSLTTGSSPTSIAAADFNNDGRLDLVVTNSSDNTVSVFLGNGGGSFQAAVNSAVGTAPMSVTTGDFDDDGNMDVAVANSGSNNVSVLLGNGNGTFQTATNVAVGSDPISIVAGDFDGNGYLDLSVANKGDNTLSDLINYGQGVFVAGNTSVAISDPVSLATGDFNHDGLTDQVSALADPGLMEMLGDDDPRATFVPRMMATSSASSTYIAVTDSSLVMVYDADNPGAKPLFDKSFRTKSVTSIALVTISGQTSFLAVGTKSFEGIGQNGVTIFDIQTGKEVDSLKLPVAPSALEFSDDGEVLVVGYSQQNAGNVGLVADINTATGQVTNTMLLKNTKNWSGVAPVTQVLVDQLEANDITLQIVTASKTGFVTWTYNPRAGTLKEVDGKDTPPGTTTLAFTPLLSLASGTHYFAFSRSDGSVRFYSITAAGAVNFVGSIMVDPPATGLPIASWYRIDAITGDTIKQLVVSRTDQVPWTIFVTKNKLAKPLTGNPLGTAHPVSSGTVGVDEEDGNLVIGEADGSIRRFDARDLGEELDPPIRPFNPVPMS